MRHLKRGWGTVMSHPFQGGGEGTVMSHPKGGTREGGSTNHRGGGGGGGGCQLCPFKTQYLLGQF